MDSASTTANKHVTFAPSTTFIKPGSYNIRLMSDYELAAISEVRFSEKDLLFEFLIEDDVSALRTRNAKQLLNRVRA